MKAAFSISPAVEKKLLNRAITSDDIVELFKNKTSRATIDTREQHHTDPPTLWFISQTDKGRILKVVFLYFPDQQLIVIKSAFEPSAQTVEYYQDHA